MTYTAQEQELLNTDFGEETEKLAEAKVDAIESVYAYGFNKMACEVADAMDNFDKTASEDEDKKKEDKEEDEDEKMDEESEKQAAELGAFIERGFFDGLCKLGSERHGDEFHYLAPYLIEKTAEMAAQEAAEKMAGAMDVIRAAGGKAKDLLGAAKGKAKEVGGKAKAMHQKAMTTGAEGRAEIGAAIKGNIGKGKKNKLTAAERRQFAVQGLKDIAKGYGAYAGAGLAGAGAAGYGVKKALD